MNLELKPGNYVVAVSGGVDSTVLLDMLCQIPDLQLTVAHFDHGIRPDSAEDRRFVQTLAKKYALPFVYDEGHLGRDASEATARAARYGFLRRVKQAGEAQAIITAHHQDDALETAILNMLRGTGRKGLTALKNQADIVRPLLKIPKAELVNYAKAQHLKWREDPTNQDINYLRNYIRYQILPRFSQPDRAKLVNIITNLMVTNQELDETLTQLLNLQKPGTIERLWFNQLPHSVAKEMMATWLRQSNLRGFDSKALERLVTAAKTAAPGKQFPVLKDVKLEVHQYHLALVGQER
ncbi:MAG TPA: tRNA lysidine(34) synthetase TilS [Candidatus Saccharimonadales bacterium]|nr:tRNA lysidine(34) synthetase TilS [Candidatus Saccharimonadales bacterium]